MGRVKLSVALNDGLRPYRWALHTVNNALAVAAVAGTRTETTASPRVTPASPHGIADLTRSPPRATTPANRVAPAAESKASAPAATSRIAKLAKARGALLCTRGTAKRAPASGAAGTSPTSEHNCSRSVPKRQSAEAAAQKYSKRVRRGSVVLNTTDRMSKPYHFVQPVEEPAGRDGVREGQGGPPCHPQTSLDGQTVRDGELPEQPCIHGNPQCPADIVFRLRQKPCKPHSRYLLRAIKYRN
eukprot:Hpha_TRINITY_DN3774_c0_g1::TRINITY_DN3774_c0_g1_i1::g.23844::m.23844